MSLGVCHMMFPIVNASRGSQLGGGGGGVPLTVQVKNKSF